MKKLEIVLLGMSLTLCVLSLSATNFVNPADSVKPPVYWKGGGTTSLAFNQVSLTNWSAGGKNSVSGSLLVKAFLNYKKDKSTWDNLLDIGYGLTKQGDDKAVKTEDKLQFATKYGYLAGKAWYYSAMANFKTQMAAGYKDPPTNSIKISELLAPAYSTFSLGMDYKPSENFSLYLSPVTSKMTFVFNEPLSNAGAYGVEPGKKMRGEFGAFAKMIAQKKNIISNVDFFTKVDLFSNLANNPQNVDVEWETLFLMKVNKYLSAMASWNILYDNDIKYIDSNNVARGARMQSKQLFGVGLTYNFGN